MLRVEMLSFPVSHKLFPILLLGWELTSAPSSMAEEWFDCVGSESYGDNPKVYVDKPIDLGSATQPVLFQKLLQAQLDVHEETSWLTNDLKNAAKVNDDDEIVLDVRVLNCGTRLFGEFAEDPEHLPLLLADQVLLDIGSKLYESDGAQHFHLLFDVVVPPEVPPLTHVMPIVDYPVLTNPLEMSDLLGEAIELHALIGMALGLQVYGLDKPRIAGRSVSQVSLELLCKAEQNFRLAAEDVSGRLEPEQEAEIELFVSYVRERWLEIYERAVDAGEAFTAITRQRGSIFPDQACVGAGEGGS